LLLFVLSNWWLLIKIVCLYEWTYTTVTPLSVLFGIQWWIGGKCKSWVCYWLEWNMWDQNLIIIQGRCNLDSPLSYLKDSVVQLWFSRTVQDRRRELVSGSMFWVSRVLNIASRNHLVCSLRKSLRCAPPCVSWDLVSRVNSWFWLTVWDRLRRCVLGRFHQGLILSSTSVRKLCGGSVCSSADVGSCSCWYRRQRNGRSHREGICCEWESVSGWRTVVWLVPSDEVLPVDGLAE
jgi:hypothetical protein